MQLPATDTLLQLATGLSLYWAFPGWLIQAELEHVGTPKRNEPGSTAFLAGQAAALMGAMAVAGLLGLSLSTWTQTLRLQPLLLGLLALLVLAQSVWIALGMALHDSHETIQKLSFESGRDLMLRHLLPLFLAFGLLVPMQSAHVVRMELMGILMGWATTNALWGMPLGNFSANLRRALSMLCLIAGFYLLWKGWQVR
jgi:hypothetical protein